MNKFVRFSKNFIYGMKRGFQWYKYMIKNESKWYILSFIFDMILLPIKLIIVIPIAWFKPEIIENSNFGQEVLYEMSREDF